MVYGALLKHRQKELTPKSILFIIKITKILRLDKNISLLLSKNCKFSLLDGKDNLKKLNLSFQNKNYICVIIA